MSEHGIFGLKPDLRLEWRGQGGHHETQKPDHSASLGDSVMSSTRIGFSVHTTNGSAIDATTCGNFHPQETDSRKEGQGIGRLKLSAPENPTPGVRLAVWGRESRDIRRDRLTPGRLCRRRSCRTNAELLRTLEAIRTYPFGLISSPRAPRSVQGIDFTIRENGN
jgi:hypothetical protein